MEANGATANCLRVARDDSKSRNFFRVLIGQYNLDCQNSEV